MTTEKPVQKRVYVDRPLDQLTNPTVRSIATNLVDQLRAYGRGEYTRPSGKPIPITPDLFPTRPVDDAAKLPVVVGLTKQ